MGDRDIEGIDTERVTAWFGGNVEGVTPPLDFTLIAGGHSNLTYRVEDAAGRAFVLRRPPLGQVLATAHDMGREHRIISALGGTDVPVAPALGHCEDPEVNGAPFYVMDFVDGTIVRTGADAAGLTPAARARASEALVEVLAAIHAVDVDAVGLGELGRRDGYIARQLKRWYGQFQGSRDQVSGLELPVVDEAHAVLAAGIPTEGATAIVHGDYRLDNCILGPDGEVRAVLDWELCTLGDPMADLGLLCVYWADPGEDSVLVGTSATTEGGFLTKAALVDRYAAASGRDVSQLDYYVAFGYWKLTCIIAGVYARYAGGAMGERGREGAAGFRTMLDLLADNTADALERIR